MDADYRKELEKQKDDMVLNGEIVVLNDEGRPRSLALLIQETYMKVNLN